MIVTRFAPSPTWFLHIGGVRTALYSRLLAKKQGGKYLLRIEDTDVERSTKAYEQNILDSFNRLGLDWDAGPWKDDGCGPYYQMERLDIYNQYIQKLIDQGHAYYAWETAEEIDVMRQEAEAAKKQFIYRQPIYTQEQVDVFKAEWRTPTVRMKLPDKVITFQDGVKGEVSFHTKEFADFVIMKWDGVPTYYLANVIDDALQHVTHVIRGEEHLSNTPKQIVIYEALGFSLPSFSHLPLIMNATTGKKLSKRDTNVGCVLVYQFKEAGFLPPAILNFIALVGRNPGTNQDVFTMEELIEAFSIERVQKSNGVYDFQRALWFNSEYIKAMSDDEFVSAVQAYLAEFGGEVRKEILEVGQSDDKDAGGRNKYWLALAPYIKVRLQTLAQFKDYCSYFFVSPTVEPELVYREKMAVTKELMQDVLPELIERLEHMADVDRNEEAIKELLIAYIGEKGLKNGQILWPLRAILTWTEASPGAFEMMTVLGKDESLKRLKDFLINMST